MTKEGLTPGLKTAIVITYGHERKYLKGKSTGTSRPPNKSITAASPTGPMTTHSRGLPGSIRMNALLGSGPGIQPESS